MYELPLFPKDTKIWFEKCCMYFESSEEIVYQWFSRYHSGIAGNCKADKLVREGTLTPISSNWQGVDTPLYSCALALDLLIDLPWAWQTLVTNQSGWGCEIVLVQSGTREVLWTPCFWKGSSRRHVRCYDCTLFNMLTCGNVRYLVGLKLPQLYGRRRGEII